MLEDLIKDLDQRGILVLQILLGQRAIEILNKEKEDKTKTKNIVTLSKPKILIEH